MPIRRAGWIIHRKAITFDYLDTVGRGGAARTDFGPGQPGCTCVLGGLARFARP